MMPDLPLFDDAWVLARRGPRNSVDVANPYAALVEPERTREGVVEDVATIFITNRECSFRCLMCDLWKNTTKRPTPRGAVPAQIAKALARLAPARHLKLYNSGNFFDVAAIPRADWPEIARLVRPFDTVIVESHPRLVDERCVAFSRMIKGRLDVAMGLETVDPDVLPRLNKRMTLDDFERAARFLVENGMHVRAFVLLRTPFQDEAAGLHWAKCSLDWAFDAGVECCAVIPTRDGNGAMEALRAAGRFSPPSLESLVEAVEYGVRLRRGRVFADLWDVDRLACSTGNRTDLVARLRRLNLAQEVPA